MNKPLIPFYILLLLICSCQHSDPDPEKHLAEDEIYIRAHRLVNWFYSNELDSLSACILEKSFTLRDLKEFREKVDVLLGEEVDLLNESTGAFMVENELVYGYHRFSRFSKSEQPVVTFFGFDRNNNIYRFEVIALQKEVYTKHADYQAKTPLRLPFEGEWHVASGGRTINYNHHAIAVDQRFAIDFLIIKDGYKFDNNGLHNEDYHCFNKKVLAPGNGIIVEVVNNIKDNKVGDMPEGAGNLVIIDHENGEFSALAHFKQGSIVVKKGDSVVSGQFLGLCGNSGHSLMPHLHYNLQTAPVMFTGEGLPAKFLSYYSDGNLVERGEPVWGQNVRNK